MIAGHRQLVTGAGRTGWKKGVGGRCGISSGRSTARTPILRTAVDRAFGRTVPTHRLIRHHNHDLVVTTSDPDATIADLVTALDPTAPPGPAWIDGQITTPATPIDRAGLLHGSEVHTSPPRPGWDGGDHRSDLGDYGTNPFTAGLRLRFTTGAACGLIVKLRSGDQILGSRPPADGHLVADPTVSGTHVRLNVSASPGVTVTVTDLNSSNGTLVNGLRAVEPVRLEVGEAINLGNARAVLEHNPRPPAAAMVGASPESDGPTIAHHRSGRRPTDPDPSAVALPEPSPPPIKPVPFGLVALVVSGGGALAMVMLLGSWRYAAFALLGPLTMLGHLADGRRNRRRGRRREQRRLRRELQRLGTDLATAAHQERRNRLHRFADAFTIDLTDTNGPHLWERRADHCDFGLIRVGHGTGPWAPPVTASLDGADPAVVDMVARHRALTDTDIGIRLLPGKAIAVVGPADQARGLARTIVLGAAAAHGPVDLGVAGIWTDHHCDWDWLAWLPHTTSHAGQTLLANDPDGAAQVTETLVDSCSPDSAGVGPHLTLCIIDDPRGLAQRSSPARIALQRCTETGSTMAAVVVLAEGAPVPAACVEVIRVAQDGTLTGPPSVSAGYSVAACTARGLAAERARAMARFEDPEVRNPSRDLPTVVSLRSVLGLSHASPFTMLSRWRAGGPDPAPTATLAVSADGPLVIDLAADGPHVLVAGTTGSGKSELLRSLVVSLAVGSSPDHLNFVLIDFKGGSAFDVCARLPHTVGVVTDLDEDLAARALRCLEAELRHRESRLRAEGASDITEVRLNTSRPDDPLQAQTSATDPFPRLVVVIDEFAALGSAVPDFVDSLVDIAQRGRSLGVHLVLATQRPAGAVNAAIQANVGLRLCLRVATAQDSVDVIGTASASELPRSIPGRALVRLGPRDLTTAQVATGAGAGDMGALGSVSVRPLGPTPTSRGGSTCHGTGSVDHLADGASDLDRLVDLMAKAWHEAEGRTPRCPWPPPLPNHVTWPVSGPEAGPVGGPETDTVGALGPSRKVWSIVADGPGPTSRLVLGLADEPDQQRTGPFTWDPARGPLLGLGLPGTGPATLAGTVTLEACRRWARPRLDVHIIDGGAGDLAPLAGLEPVGAVVGPTDLERQRRAIGALAIELARRKADPGLERPPALLVVHGVNRLRLAWEEIGDTETWSRLVILATEGSACGIHLCMTSEAGVPQQLLAVCEQRLLFRLGDPGEVAAHGISPRAVPTLGVDRAVTVVDGQVTVVQVARPDLGLAGAVAQLSGPGGGLPTTRWVGVLPRQVSDSDLWTELEARCVVSSRSAGHSERGVTIDGPEGIGLPLGLADRDLGPVSLHLAPGSHALIAGPPRSGRTTTLVRLAVDAAGRVPTYWISPPSSTAPSLPTAVRVLPTVARAVPAGAFTPEHLTAGPVLVLVDDAERIDAEDPVLVGLVSSRNPGVHVVAACRNDRARTQFGHWTREVRAHGTGLLLNPDLDLDGDLLGVRLPRRPMVDLVVGRGWLTGPDQDVSGFVQVAMPPVDENGSFM